MSNKPRIRVKSSFGGWKKVSGRWGVRSLYSQVLNGLKDWKGEIENCRSGEGW